MAPPPPPPPPPPPVPGALKVPKTAQPAKKCSTSLNASKKPTDIDALLSEIRGGTRLKRVTQVNDRSAPIVPGNLPLTSF